MKIAMIDDHTLFRNGLAAIIAKNSKHSVTLQASDGKDFMNRFKVLPPSSRPTLILTDHDMKEINGTEIVRWLAMEYPETQAIVLSLNDNDSTIIGAIRAGARAYIHKTADASEIITAIDQVAANGFYINNHLSNGTDTNDLTQRIAMLDTYEKTLFAHLCLDINPAAIAAKAGMTRAEYMKKQTLLFQKLGVSKRLELYILSLKLEQLC